MHKMKRTQTKRSHSWWWDSHISPKNSKWLAENLEEMDKSVKQMLKLIEEDADSFAKKAEMYYQKRPELISLVEDFYRVYRSLAERYDHVTGELRKNIPSELQSQGSSGGSDFGSEPPSPSPEHKPPRHKPKHRAAGFEFFLGSGGSSDLSRKGSDGSSSSDSGSESDEVSSKYHLSSPVENGNGDALRRRIIELESELLGVKEKLQESKREQKFVENGNHEELHAKISMLEEELIVANEKLSVSAEEIARLKRELDQHESLETKQELQKLELSLKENASLDAELEFEKKQVAELREQIPVLEIRVSDHEDTIKKLKVEISDVADRFSREKSEIEVEFSVSLKSLQDELVLEKKRKSELQERILGLENDVLDRNNTIEELKVAIANAKDGFLREKLLLEAKCSGLSESRVALEAKLNESVLMLEDEIKRLRAEKSEMQVHIDRLKTENTESGKCFEQLNHGFDELKLKYDMLMAERDELCAKVQSLVADANSRDDRIRQMEEHSHRLHIEHVELIAGSENARKLTRELQTKVKELEEEIARQRVSISEYAEEKREVIRQLCFSLEHYRDGYYQLRQALHGYKRPTVMAS
ncbi:protein NETWORKED 4B-like [Tasmannia lanceolata]|uniref:protein NETWORKED 4B-like n=1 Tax=Tasmannia lanceolata TaxID=3420 RepID=UPI0040647EE0